MNTMQALRFNEYGDPGVLAVEEIARPEAAPDEVLVKVAAASVNPSDVKNVQGALKASLPRTPGRDFAGTVVSPGKWQGAEVWGSGAGFGIGRDGANAEYLAIPSSWLALKPAHLSMSQAAACGIPFLIAWMGLVDTGALAKGERLLVTGVSGAVGQAAVQLARWKGAEVIGADRTEASGGITSVRTDDPDWIKKVREWSQGGVDMVLDAVGGPLFEPCLHCLRRGGRQIAIASTGEPKVSFHLPDFFHELLHLAGADTFKLSGEDIARIMNEIRAGFEQGILTPPRVQEHPLERARDAYEAVSQGAKGIRQVIVF